MYSTWSNSRLATVATMAMLVFSTAVVGLVLDGPAQAGGSGGGGSGGRGFGGGGFSRGDGFGGTSQARTNVYAPYGAYVPNYGSLGGSGDSTLVPSGLGYGPGDLRSYQFSNDYDVYGGGWGYGWGGNGVGATIAGAAAAGTVTGAPAAGTPQPCVPYYYGTQVYCR